MLNFSERHFEVNWCIRENHSDDFFVLLHLSISNVSINKISSIFMFQDSRLITIQFSWKKEVKPKGSSLIGVSPEFETALYTVAYMMGKQEYHAILGKDRVIIKCHRRKDGMIGTCYLQEPHFEHLR